MSRAKVLAVLALILVVASVTAAFTLRPYVLPAEKTNVKNADTVTTSSSRPVINKFTVSQYGFNLTAELNLLRVHYSGDVYIKIRLTNIANTSSIVEPVVGLDVRNPEGVKVYGFEARVYGNDSKKIFKVGESWSSGKGLHWKAIEDPLLRVDIPADTYTVTVYSRMYNSDERQVFQIVLKDISVIVIE